MTQKPRLATEKFTIVHGSEVIKGLAIANYDPGAQFPESAQPDVTVFGNGAFGSVRTFGPIIRGYLRAAAHKGHPVRALTYFDPWFGSAAYTASYRAERLHRMTQHAAKDTAVQKVHLVGHSWSWPGAVMVAGESPELLHTLAGYTPVGHRGNTPALGRLGVLQACVQEGLRTKPAIALEALPALGALAVAMAGRLPDQHAMNEALDLFALDLTDAVAKVRNDLPVGMLIAQQDALFGIPADTRDQLEANDIITTDLATTHSGAIMHPKYGAELYQLTKSLASVPGQI